VVDDGSTDRTRDIVRERFPHAILLEQNHQGPGAARNLGAKRAKGEVLVFTDADIIADVDLLARHAATHAEHKRLIAVVGQEVQVDSLEEYEGVRHVGAERRTLHPDTRKRLSWLYFLTGNASVPREILMQVGLFDEEFTGYGHEDLELGYRLWCHGVPIHYNARAVNFHWHPLSFEERCAKMKLAGVSTMRFYNKHRDFRIKLLLGVNPASQAMHALLARFHPLLRSLQQHSATSKLCSELLLQYHYLCGVREGRLTRVSVGNSS